MSPQPRNLGGVRRPRGQCPSCGRDVALWDDGRVAVRHDKPDGGRCRGQGEKALPLSMEAERWPSPEELAAERFDLPRTCAEQEIQRKGTR